MNVSIVDDEIFPQLVEEYTAIKRAQKEMNVRLDEILKEFESYANVDKKSDFEGLVTLSCGNTNVKLNYKINRTLQKNLLVELCKKVGKPANAIVNVRYEYPGVKFIAEMDPDLKEEMQKCFTEKRGKTSIEIETTY